MGRQISQALLLFRAKQNKHFFNEDQPLAIGRYLNFQYELAKQHLDYESNWDLSYLTWMDQVEVDSLWMLNLLIHFRSG